MNLKSLLFLVLLAISLSLSIFPIGDSDSWWHLKTGEYIVQHRTIPTTDIFSYTAYGNRWITHEWLFEALAYGVYAIGGLDGVIVAKAILVCCFFLVLLIFCEQRQVPTAFTVLFLLLLGLLSTGRFSERPQLFTFLFTAVFLLILYNYRDFGKNWLPALPVITVLWANIHSGFIFGLGIATVFAVVEGVLHRKWDRRLALIILISYAASLLNPNTYHAVFYPFWLVTNPTFKNVITELQSPYHPIHATATFVFYFHLVLVLTVGAILWRGLRHKIWDITSILLVILFTVGTILASRNRVLFAVVTVPVFAGLFTGFQPDRIPQRIWRLFHLAVVLIGMGFVLYTLKFGLKMDRYTSRQVKLGVENWTPTGAVQFIRQANLQGNLFNHFSFGGYLIWSLYPDRLIFIDGRNDVFGEDLFQDYRTIMRRLEGFEALIDTYRIDYFVLRTPAADWYGREESFIHSYLAPHPDWALVYFDDVSLIYARRGSVNDAVIAKYGYRYLNPLADNQVLPGVHYADHADSIRQEVNQLVAEQPNGIFAHMTAANVYVKLKQFDRARDIYDRLKTLDPKNPDVFKNLGILNQIQQRLADAEAAYQHAIQLDRKNPNRYTDLANYYFDIKAYERAVRQYQVAQHKGDDSPFTMLNLAICYRQMGGHAEANSLFEQVRDQFPESPAAQIAQTYLNLDQFELHYNRADSLSKAGRLDDAIEEYQIAIHLNPKDARAHNNLGFLFWRKGMVDKALSQYTIAHQLDSLNVDALNNLGVVYGSQGDFEQARFYWNKVLAIDSTHAARQNLQKLDELENP